MAEEAAHPEPARGDRLDSWKEIAAYLKRDVRTAQRWEKQEGLPVRRHLHDERATAYAFTHEIDQWLEQRRQQEPESVVSADVSGARSDLDRSPAARKLAVRPLAVVAIALAATSGLLLWSLTRSRLAPTTLSSLSVVFAPSEQFREWGPDMALSPDGSTLVYNGAGLGPLRIRRIDRLESRVLDGTLGSAPFFSPDGRWIGFRNLNELMKVSVDGGTPVPLGATAGFMGSADWGSDDFIVYATTTPQGTHGLYRLAARGGTPQLVAALGGKEDDAYWLTPQSIANGTVILCTLARAVSSGSRYQVVAVSVATGQRHVLVDDAKHGLYLGDGILVYVRKSALFATRLDLNRLEVTGPQVPSGDNVSERERLRSWTYANGTLVYWPIIRQQRRLVWVDRSGARQPLPLPPAMYQSPRLSPDGAHLAFSVTEAAEFGDLWQHDLTTGATLRLTTNRRSLASLWTPDGTGIVYSMLGSSGRDLMRIRLDNATDPEPIHLPSGFLTGASLEPATWMDSGRTLLVRQSGLSSQPLLWAVALDGNLPPRAVLPHQVTWANHARVSPDGRWIAYESSGDERTEVFVAPVSGGPPFWRVSTAGGSLPVWSRTGRELYYRVDNRMMAAPVTRAGTFVAGEPRMLFEGHYFEGEPGGPNYDVALDDQHFLMVLPGDTEGPDRLNVVQGWKAETLRRLGKSR